MIIADAARGVARTMLWLPMKSLRFFVVLAMLSPLIMGINAENLLMAAVAALAYVSMPRLWRRMGGK